MRNTTNASAHCLPSLVHTMHLLDMFILGQPKQLVIMSGSRPCENQANLKTTTEGAWTLIHNPTSCSTLASWSEEASFGISKQKLHVYKAPELKHPLIHTDDDLIRIQPTRDTFCRPSGCDFEPPRRQPQCILRGERKALLGKITPRRGGTNGTANVTRLLGRSSFNASSATV